MKKKEYHVCQVRWSPTDIPEKTHQGSSDPGDILQKLDFSGIEEWEPQLQQEAQDLIH